jgi:molybdopterin-binding protein
LFRNSKGYDVELYIETTTSTGKGIHLWTSITENSFIELGLEIEKQVWVSFKASAVRLL